MLLLLMPLALCSTTVVDGVVASASTSCRVLALWLFVIVAGLDSVVLTPSGFDWLVIVAASVVVDEAEDDGNDEAN